MICSLLDDQSVVWHFVEQYFKYIQAEHFWKSPSAGADAEYMERGSNPPIRFLFIILPEIS